MTSPASASFRALGTTVVVLVTDAVGLGAAVAAVEDVLDHVDRACSRVRPDSDLARVNRSGGHAVRVSPMLIDAVASLSPGPRCVDVDEAAGTVRVPDGVELDLGSTVRALAADRAAAAAADEGRCGVLVALGGDVAVAGPAPADGWAVRIADDLAVAIASGGMATSGTTARWRTVTVAAATCLRASAASAAAVVLGDEAPDWLAARGLAARLVRDDGRATCVAGWPA